MKALSSDHSTTALVARMAVGHLRVVRAVKSKANTVNSQNFQKSRADFYFTLKGGVALGWRDGACW